MTAAVIVGAIIFGFLLILVEIFLIPGINIFGILGGVCILVGIYQAYVGFGVLEAVEAFGQFVHNTHCKDAVTTKTPGKMGTEVALGEGEVDFPALIAALYGVGFRGPLTIEREISGPKQIADIKQGKAFLEEIRAKVLGE